MVCPITQGGLAVVERPLSALCRLKSRQLPLSCIERRIR